MSFAHRSSRYTIKRITVFGCVLLLSLTAFWRLTGLRIVYVSPQGDDVNPGTKTLPVRSIQRGVNLAQRGGLIEILQGDYRETVHIPHQNKALPLILRAENKKGKHAVLLGSEPSSDLLWNTCTDATCKEVAPQARRLTYVTEIPWDEPPTMLIYKNKNGTDRLLTLARSPNQKISDKNKYHEHWWNSDNPGTSLTALSDINHLSNAPSLTGGRAYIIDGADRCGTYLYTRAITGYNPQSASFTVDMPIGAQTYGTQESGLSAYSKYFIENAAGLLDVPGEWFYDQSAKKLYLFPPEPVNPRELSIEIARRNTGVLVDRSRVSLLNLTIKNTNDATYSDKNTGAVVMSPGKNLHAIRIKNITIQNAGNGISGIPLTTGSIRNVSIDSSYIQNVSKSAISFMGLQNVMDTITGITVRNSSITDTGFPLNEPAVAIVRSSDVYIHKNTITDTASYGIHVTGFEKAPIVSRNITIARNSVSRTCQNASSCAAVKIFGGKFVYTMVKNNTLSENLGWSYCHALKNNSQGYAMGVFISNAGGISVARNTSINNSGPAFLAYTRQIPATNNIFFRNTAAYSSVGISLDGATGELDADPVADRTRHRDTHLIKNTLQNNGIGIRLDPYNQGALRVRHNSYVQNGIALVYGNKEVVVPSDINIVFPLWEK